MAETSLKEEEKLKEKDLQPNSFPKSFRILKKKEYKNLFNNRLKVFGNDVVIDYQINQCIKNPKIGITVPKKFGKSHTRNKFKRVVKESFRLNKSHLPKNIVFNVYPKKDIEKATLKGITEDLLSLKNLI